MSTILKALKQVDQTAPPEEIESWPPQINTKETVRARVKKIRLNRKIYLTIAVVLIIAAAGWLVYNQKDMLLAMLSSGSTSEEDELTSPASSKKGPVYQAKIYPPASKQTVSLPKKDSRPKMGNQGAGLKSEPNQTHTDKQPGTLPQNRVKNQDSATAGKTGSPPKAMPPNSQMPRSQTADLKKPVQKQGPAAPTAPPQTAKPPPKQVTRSYRRLDDSRLKLQAIAWSDNAAQRIAVVNDHVVREGESVEGFSVNQIRQDDIIVNDGTESWRLEFGLK